MHVGLDFYDTLRCLGAKFQCSVIGSVCDEGHFRCHDWFKSPVKCISDSVVCDGYDNCKDKADEDKELCRGNKTRSYTLYHMLYSITCVWSIVFNSLTIKYA